MSSSYEDQITFAPREFCSCCGASKCPMMDTLNIDMSVLEEAKWRYKVLKAQVSDTMSEDDDEEDEKDEEEKDSTAIIKKSNSVLCYCCDADAGDCKMSCIVFDVRMKIIKLKQKYLPLHDSIFFVDFEDERVAVDEDDISDLLNIPGSSNNETNEKLIPSNVHTNPFHQGDRDASDTFFHEFAFCEHILIDSGTMTHATPKEGIVLKEKKDSLYCVMKDDMKDGYFTIVKELMKGNHMQRFEFKHFIVAEYDYCEISNLRKLLKLVHEQKWDRSVLNDFEDYE